MRIVLRKKWSESVRCEMGDCPNVSIAEITFEDGTETGIFLCEQCLKKLCEESKKCLEKIGENNVDDDEYHTITMTANGEKTIMNVGVSEKDIEKISKVVGSSEKAISKGVGTSERNIEMISKGVGSSEEAISKGVGTSERNIEMISKGVGSSEEAISKGVGVSEKKNSTESSMRKCKVKAKNTRKRVVKK